MAKKGSRAAGVSSVVESIPIQVVSPTVPLAKEKPVKKAASVKQKVAKAHRKVPNVKKQTTKTFKAQESKTAVIAIRQGLKGKDISETKEKVSAVRTPLPPRRNRAKEFVVKIRRMTVPEIKRAHMKVVTYVGVFYILVGISAASYALAEMNAAGSLALFGMSDAHRAEVITTTLSTESGTGTSAPVDSDAAPSSDTTITPASTGITAPTTATPGTVSETTGGTITNATETSGAGTAPAATSLSSAPVTTTASASSTPTLSAEDLAPKAFFVFSKKAPFNEKVGVTIKVRKAEKVELGVMPKNGLTTLYLGRAYRVPGTEGEWQFLWDTRHIPNGGYSLAARVMNQYGSYTSAPEFVSVFNPVPTTTPPITTSVAIPPAMTEAVTTIESEMGSSLTETAPAVIEDAIEEDDEVSEEVVDATPVPARTPVALRDTPPVPSMVVEDTTVVPVRAVGDVLPSHVQKFKQRLAALIERFATAHRAGKVDALTFVKQEIEVLKQETMSTVKALHLSPEGNYEKIEQELDALIAQEIARIEMRERMIVERVGDAIVVDSDSDGIVDYDEVNLYKTDPRIADSDNDGFTDGAEIISGHNPTDAAGEVMIAFENPETQGPAREDILVVESINTEFKEDGGAVGARLSGKGLPNSFVTLYIFSTPVVVTVRTADDGSWSYVFDKELEDGSHTLYVGITDNAGRIVAKSQPFPFVKTAEAFTGGTGEVRAAAPVVESPDILSSGAMLLIAALSLILLGLALVALGAYFMRPLDQELSVVPA